MSGNRPASVLLVCVIVAPFAAFGVIWANAGLDPMLMLSHTHFWAVGATALAALAACGVMVASARSLRETRLLFLTLAFASIAGIFSVHGLMTPGVITHEYYASVSVSAWLSIIVGAVFAALSAAPLPAIVERSVRKAGGAIFAWAVIALGAYIALSFTVEGWLNSVPVRDQQVQYAIASGATALLAFAAWRYWQAYVFARLPAQAAMTAALLLLCEVPAILVWGRTWHLSWWLYHAIYGEAFVVLLAGWALEAKRAGSLTAISDALSMRDALAQLNRGRDAHVLELVDAIETKDVATHGHVGRVGAYALAIGQRMRLSPAELRSLTLAAQMHDVGKIGVPDAILTKPGKLTEDEFAEVKRHTTRGEEIARRVPALAAVAPVIRAHHERMHGQGYPDGLAGDAIPLLARIIAVADSYDAMTSQRSYRQPRSHADAILELLRVRGDELDPACVDAFLSWCDEGQAAAA